jgi:superfamily II DNA or RNA helicase
MLADKDIDAALELIDAWNEGDVDAKGSLTAMSDRYADRKTGLAMNTYPSISNPNFHELLQKMRELYIEKLSPSSFDKLQGRTKALLRHQQFVKAYMSPGTGYNGILLVHDVGVGKTCTAVAIAEMYHATMSNPAIILTGSSLKSQWRDEIAGVGKAQFISGAWKLPSSCAGNVYDRVSSRVTVESRKMLENAVHATIKTRYEFYGYIEFNNKYRGIQSTNVSTREELIRQEFSDRVIIVDEAHHLRSTQDAIEANDALTSIVRNTSNVKIVLLTATPMFDKAPEIINLLNIMRGNDGRGELNVADFFDQDGELTNVEGLADACRGYISYVRGGDPATFPTQLSPSTSTGKPASRWPKLGIDGKTKQPKSEMIELVTSPASALQEAVTLRTLSEGGVREDEDVSSTRQISTIVYPGDGKSVEDQIKQCVSGTMTEGNMQYREGHEGMFGKDLNKYSPKISTVLGYLKGCRGIAMVYTFWIPGGILPMAFALEEAGYTRAEGPPLLDTKTPKNGKRYAIITGNTDLTTESSKIQILKKIKDIKNIDGSLISVLLVTQTVSEGVDLKNIREVHILDPWWNMGRPDQIIGRAARYMSHISLPESQRNVTIYNHVCALSGDREGIDHVYIKRALQKRSAISDVLEVLRAESVDCAFNKETAYIKPNKSVTMETSQGRKIQWKLGDQDYSKACLYKKCVPTTKICTHDHLLAPKAGILYVPDTNDMKIVTALLEYEFDTGDVSTRLSFDEIRERLSDISDDILVYAVDMLIRTKARFNLGGDCIF